MFNTFESYFNVKLGDWCMVNVKLVILYCGQPYFWYIICFSEELYRSYH